MYLNILRWKGKKMTKLINTRTGKIVKRPKRQTIKESPCTNCVVYSMCREICPNARSFMSNGKVLVKIDDRVWDVIKRLPFRIHIDPDRPLKMLVRMVNNESIKKGYN